MKDIGSFHRFLRVAALMHGQIVNAANIARDAAVARATVQRFIDVLVDTLVGFRLPGWQPRAKVREHHAAKFYFFDPGAVRMLTGRIDAPLGEEEAGALLEGYVVHEVRAALAYQNLGGELSYWRSGPKEVDLVWQRGDHCLGIEVKASTQWRPNFAKTLNELIDAKVLRRGIVVYRGTERLRVGEVDAIPATQFFSDLYRGLLDAT